MGNVWLDLLWINIFCVVCIDQLQIDQPLKRLIWKVGMKGVPYKNFTLKPFDCALCASWWLGLLYIILTGNLSLLMVVVVLGYAYLNFIINDILTTLKEWWARLMDKLL